MQLNYSQLLQHLQSVLPALHFGGVVVIESETGSTLVACVETSSFDVCFFLSDTTHQDALLKLASSEFGNRVYFKEGAADSRSCIAVHFLSADQVVQCFRLAEKYVCSLDALVQLNESRANVVIEIGFPKEDTDAAQ